MIHVCFSLYDKNGRYSKFTGTTILSLFENTTLPITVHILHDNTLTQDNRDKFIYLAVRYGQTVKFYNVEELCADKLKKMIELIPDAVNSRVSVAALYRLLIPQLLPGEIEKYIYLDSDIIVNLDINELWQINLGDKILAAVPEILSYKTIDAMKFAFSLCNDDLVKPEDYFNSGVLLVNLKLLRNEESTIINALRFRSQNPMYQDYFDQNILNYCFSAKTVKLPVKFNRYLQVVRLYAEPLARKIYHYSGGSFGLGLTLDMSDEFNRLWMNYFSRTPWFNAKAIARLYEAFFKVQVELKKSAMNLSAALKGKTRIFITLKENLDMLIENFSVRNDEEVIVIESGTPIRQIIEVMNLSRGEKMFFFLLKYFPFNKLEEAGFVRGRDFIDAYDFSPENLRKPQISYTLLQSM